MTNMFGDYWYPTKDGDAAGLALYRRHYTFQGGRSRLFVAPGEKMVLLTSAGDALFVWVHNTVARWDNQVGVNCAVFRNESPARSSDLIKEACQWAWERWPGLRLFTYVDGRKIRSTNPGYCFLAAGWQRCGTSKSGLAILDYRT